MVVVVLVDTICTIADIDARAGSGETAPAIVILADVCLALYTLEMIVMLWLRGLRMLKELSTQLDVLIIGCGVVEKALNLIWGQEDSTIISLIRVLRLVCIFRITRLLQRTKALRELSKLVSMMATCLKALVWSFIFCFVIMTVWAMLMVEFIYPLILELSEDGTFGNCPQCTRATSSVMSANVLLFKTVIAGDSWGEIAVPVIEKFPWTAIVFMGSLLTLVFGVLNLIVAVVVDTFAEARQRDVLNLAEDLEVDLANDQKVLQKMFERMDEDGSGLVSFEELVAGARKDPEFQSRLRVMDIDEADLRQLFDMIDTTGMGEIESSEFIAALSRWVHDSKTAPRFVKYNMLRSLEMQDDLYHIVREQFEFLFQQIEYSNLALEALLKENCVLNGPSGSRSHSLAEFRRPMPEKPPEATGFTEDVEEIALAVSKLVEAELPERPHPSNICASMFAPTPPIQMKDGLQADARHEGDVRDATEATPGGTATVASAAVAQVEQMVLQATEVALKRSLGKLERLLHSLPASARESSSSMGPANRKSSRMPSKLSGIPNDLASAESQTQLGAFHRPPPRFSTRMSRRSSSSGGNSRPVGHNVVRLSSETKPVRMPVGTFSAPGASVGLASAGWTPRSRRHSMHHEVHHSNSVGRPWQA